MKRVDLTGQKPDDSSEEQTLTTGRLHSFASVTDIVRPDECARALTQHPTVRDVTRFRDWQSAYLEVTLSSDTGGVPAGVVRILYRRRWIIVEVTTVAAGQHRQVTARPERWSA